MVHSMKNSAAKISELLTAMRKAQPVVIQSFNDDHDDLRCHAEECFERFDCEVNLPKLRVFKDRGQRGDLQLELLRRAKKSGEKIPDWVKRVIDVEQEYCLVVNGISKWSEHLHSYFCGNLTKPIVREFGAFSKPFDAYLFAGNYEFTPFGVHYDWEDSILLHLGPSEKTAYYWPDFDPSDLRWEASLKVNRFDFEDFPHPPTKVILKPGDLFYIPKNAPHVMANGEFSMTLGLIPNPSTRLDVLTDLITETANNFKSKSGDGIQNHVDSFSELASEISAVSDLKRLYRAYRIRQKRFNSNGWLVPSPDLRGLKRDPSVHTYKRSEQYPCEFFDDGDEIRLFVRGRDLIFPRRQSLIGALEYLNGRDEITLKKFTSLLSGEFTIDAATDIFQKIVELGGIYPVIEGS